MELISWVPTIVTAIATVVVAIATIHYARILKENARRLAERPRKEDEINSLIVPLISTCNGEITQLSKKWYSFLKFELFSENIKKNDYKEIVFKEFIKGKNELKITINDHEEIILALREKHQCFVNTINTSVFRKKVKELHREFNLNSQYQIFDQKLDSLTRSITMRILENSDVNYDHLNDPIEKFWEINRNYFLNIRKKKKVQEYLKELEIWSNKLIEQNKFIIEILRNIVNEYTKDYGISLRKELVDIY